MQKNVLCFIDFQKAFDTVRHNQLVMLKEIGIDGKIRVVTNLYWNQKTAVRARNQPECIYIKGMRQE